MKIGLLLAFLVLLASTNVYGASRATVGKKDSAVERGRVNKGSERDDVDEHLDVTTPFDVAIEVTERATLDRKKPTIFKADVRPDGIDIGINTDLLKSRKPATVDIDAEKPVKDDKEVHKDDTTTNLDGPDKKPVDEEPEKKPVDDEEPEKKPVDDKEPEKKPVDDKEPEKKPVDDKEPEKKPVDDEEPEKKPIKQNRRPGVEVTDEKPVSITIGKIPENIVRVSGNIVLIKYRPSPVDAVRYDLDGGRLVNGINTELEHRPQTAFDFIARRSRVTLYVSTSKTVDPKLAFAKYDIRFREEHFPLSFDIDVELPERQRGLLERAEITLYFFVYINNRETRMDTFVPAGTSQILLQGTHELIQKLDVYVRASGIEIMGLFRGRFGEQYIQPGTSFQVYVVSEKTLTLLHESTFESVAQLTLNNLPAMLPAPFSLTVNYQLLLPDTKYFIIAYVIRDGVRTLIQQAPIWIIDEHKILVSRHVIFNVVPNPLMISGRITRAQPGPFVLQPDSSLLIRFHEVGSEMRDTIFRLPELTGLPRVFQVNLSDAIRFDASKEYNVRVFIVNKKNDIYMASLQSILLTDQITQLILPVDDLSYFVQVNLESSTSQALSFIEGSSIQVLVSDSPETPSKPIYATHIDSITTNLKTFSIQIPTTAVQRGHNYYLIMMVEINGIITHVSKTLLISNNQPPPLVIRLPVISLNLISGTIFEVDNRPAQWSSESFVRLYLLHDRSPDPEKNIVQEWVVHLENNFPIRFEVQIDFSHILSDRPYYLQAAIENGRGLIEYRPLGNVLVVKPNTGIITDVRIPVTNVKTHQLITGLVYMTDFKGVLPEHAELIISLSSSPSLTNPSIIKEISVKVDGRSLPIEFTMNLPLKNIDLNSVYYFLVRYVVHDVVIIPSTQVFAFLPRNEAKVVLTVGKVPLIPITGQISSTGGSLVLPKGSVFHIYITDNVDPDKPEIYSEVFLEASINSLYEFRMNLNSLIVQKKIPLYVRADILFGGKVIISMPRPALLQITAGGEWNINLVLDLPTLIIGKIITMSKIETISGEVDGYVQIIESGTTNVVQQFQLRIKTDFPQEFRVLLSNGLFSRYTSLEVRALVKNCKEQILFESGGAVSIRPGLNLDISLPVVLLDASKLSQISISVNETASTLIGKWVLSVTGTDSTTGIILPLDGRDRSRK